MALKLMVGLCLFISGISAVSSAATAVPNVIESDMAAGFKNVPPDAKLRMFWRVFGPAWSKQEIDRQMGLLHDAGVGGVMTCFTYPVTLDDPAQNITNDTFLSPTFLETFAYAASSAKRNGIKFGVCGGTGWPFGGPTVSLHDAAQRVRAVELHRTGTAFTLPTLRSGESVLAIFQGQRYLGKDAAGIAHIAAGSPSEKVQAFITGPTYMQVKRASLGAEGYVLDHYSAEATERYLQSVVAPMLDSAPSLVNSLFCDSLEVYNGNWTHDLPAEFKKRRGYELIPRLPLLFDERNPESGSVRFDFWRTLAELAEERFAMTVHTFCAKRGVDFVLEAYGTPPMGLTAATACDVPWGEQYEWKGFSFSRFAASGGHLAGKKVIGAEAWTWTGIPNRIADTLSDLKLCTDLHFLAGENELTGVDYAYSPAGIAAPGWTPYYGPVINQNNPQWHCFSGLAAYCSRCQWMLRQGKPAADVALYIPVEDSFAEGPTNQMPLDFQIRDRMATGTLTGEFGLDNARKHHSSTIQTILTSGYNFDGIDFFSLNRLVSVKDGKLVGRSSSYRILILPDIHGIELSAMRRIASFCKSGGTVIALKNLPHLVYGANKSDMAALIQLLAEMFHDRTAGAPYSVRHYGSGQAVLTENDGPALRAALRDIGKPVADVGLEPADLDARVTHVHRVTSIQDIYFIANVSDADVEFSATFRTRRSAASLWDPITGEIHAYDAQKIGPESMRAKLKLPARGSTFICFESARAVRPAAPAQFAVESTEALDFAWQVSFEGPDAPAPVTVNQLTSWTTWKESRYFSGLAHYRSHFTVNGKLGDGYLLRFGSVRDTARVFVNGKYAGMIWNYPCEIRADSLVKSGDNTIEVIVGNLPVNRVLGLPEPDLKPLRAVFGERFPAPEEKQLMAEPSPSGLIGAVELQTLRKGR